MAVRIINRKVYDTKKAKLIYCFENNYRQGDIKFLAEDLYRTQKGNFFLLGSGGAMTKYGVDASGDTNGTNGNIIPLDKAEVIDWLEKYQGSEKILELFPGECEDA